MKPFKLTILSIILLLSQPVFAEEEEEEDVNGKDYVKIFFLPSRGNFIYGDPTVDMKVETFSFVENEEIKKHYLHAKLILSLPEIQRWVAGRGDNIGVGNSEGFHDEKTEIAVRVKGQTISLAYSGKSSIPEFARYDREWLAFYRELLDGMVDKIPVNPMEIETMTGGTK
ncbi:hypothetical protein [Methylomagnum ishizawai]|uniref:hypothetical protein n=1 Tax=Methylomagnum ishizawai TaxID=1760988 RepID=UPI001C32D523|nr:hypothetical protein [Methylomagnum ishizawai]BBL74540.1 hypothetical protein MishRS11D_16380 [Methylomagnum ishizawai]